MGAYLTQPNTEKFSCDEFSDVLVVGASSMQGWRNSQEDAHNLILNFDANTSFFAVYDGHGGAEVAQYCADKLPEFLKSLEVYKSGKLEQALKDAYLGFDKTLLDSAVVNILKILAGEHNKDENASRGDDDEEDENLAELCEESSLPLNKVLEKYQGLPQTHDLSLLKEAAAPKLVVTAFRGRRAAAVAAEAANKAVMDPTAKPAGSSTSAAAAAAFNEIDGPGSSCSSTAKMEPEDESTVSSSSSSASKTTNSSSTSNAIKDGLVTGKSKSNSVGVAPTEQNGSVTSSEAKAVVKTGNESEDATVSGSNDIADTKPNGSMDKSVSTKAEPADISSTSKESVKVIKKFPMTPYEDSTDDDADYDENALPKAQKLSEADSSSDEDMDEDGHDDEDDDDEDENASEEDDADEDQLANDQFCANMIEEPGKDSGCTAVVCVLQGRDLYVANAGDSRCVISRNGKAIEMSLDHKPEDEEECARIVRAGGRVTLDGRVNGGLNLSRALGDHAYKANLELPAEEQMISALPDVKKLIITPDTEFMVLACDGIWNFMSSDEVVDFVRERLQDEDKKISKICEELFDHCLAPNTVGDGTGCDNMTAVIVKFKENLQKLPATLNPAETEDAFLEAFEQKQQAANVSAVKRSASPDAGIDGADQAGNPTKSKRLKIEGDSESEGMEKNSTDAISSTPSSGEQQESVALNSGSESSVVASST